MKTENTLMCKKVITYLLLFLCAACVSFQLTIYGVQYVQEIQESQLASINHEYKNFGDGSNNSIIHKLISKKFNHIKVVNNSGLLSFFVGSFNIILTIQINESYIYEHNFFKIYVRSLVAQKIRLNN